MNPITEKPTDTHLRFSKLIDNSDNTLNSKFQSRFLQTPCQGCGSADHPLLSLASSTVHGDNIKYKYTCHVVDETPLYPNDFDGIRILYSLGARKYAEYYHYDLDEASNKEILRANQTRQIQPECFDTFMNDVRRYCLQHQEGIKQQTESKTAKLPIVQISTRSLTKKRKMDEMETESQGGKYQTPPKQARKIVQTSSSAESMHERKRPRK
jgi:hypothetical protein